ncbi:uncharacterized protein K02A2.6-like [Ylistrum balloti]|uniref:uncharacterized protein K02A2.6-like n=1 Tax=Ylistrum balloti TaxID=509963 RepID=UPI002905E4EF|nr:uncharacterized protein K02A2.6-like [Ylistrum balloti]
MMRNGKPVEYASRALTSCERKWAQIEKEALATLYGVERFNQYTYGRKVIIENDHKPLESILKKPLSSAPRRLQDIIMKLYRYDVEFQFLKGTSLVIADTLSRAFLDEARQRIMNIRVHEDIPDVRLEEIRKTTLADPELQVLADVITTGWPDTKEKVPSTCKPYYDIRDTLGIVDGLEVKGEAVVIPKALRSDIKLRLHKSHAGFDSMMRRAKGTVYWPSMKSEIKQMAETCEACQEMAPRSVKPPLKQHYDGDSPWSKVTSTGVVNILKKQFAHFGIPKTIVSDGGPQFTSKEFQLFTDLWGISHVTSSPQHQRANGKAESTVKVIKHIMLKCERNKEDQCEALMEQRNVPRQDTGLSPSEMLFGRKTRTLLPHLPRALNDEDMTRKREQRKKSVKRYYDKTARDLPCVSEGKSVYFQHKEHERWILGRVIECNSDRTYMIQAQSGAIYR